MSRHQAIRSMWARCPRRCRTIRGSFSSYHAAFDPRTFRSVVLMEDLSARGWSFPVAFDRDAAVFNLYGIGDCPTTIFARRSGISAGTRRGNLSDAQLSAAVRALLQGRTVQ